MLDESFLDGLNMGELRYVPKELLAEVKRVDEADPDNDDNPRLERLIDLMNHVIERLDPLMREHLRGKPDALAEWDEIIHSCDDLNDDLQGQLPADCESTAIS